MIALISCYDMPKILILLNRYESALDLRSYQSARNPKLLDKLLLQERFLPHILLHLFFYSLQIELVRAGCPSPSE